MIRPIDIRLNAAHPELPLCEAVTYTGSPSTVLIRGVPPNCGRWAITAVFVAASFPDGSTTTRAAVQSANGVWVATLPATATSGRTANGIRVIADGVDENGEAVTGYILGVADFAVASLDVTPAPEPGETSYQMLYFDTAPSVLRKGDVTKIDGVLKFYNGTAWETFAAAADVPTPSSTAPVMDGTATPGVSNDYARGDHVHPTDTSRMAATATGASIAVSGTDATKISAALAGKASTNDVTLTSPYWTIDGGSPNYTDLTIKWSDAAGQVGWAPFSESYGGVCGDAKGDVSSTELSWTSGVDISEEIGSITATRSAAYQLGSQSDKPLASEAEAEALRTGKQDALTAQQLANIAAVPDKLDKSGGDMTGPLTIIRGGDNVKIDGSTIRFNDDEGFANGGTISGTPNGGNVDLPQSDGTLAITANIPYTLTVKAIDNGAVSLDDRAINAVAVSSSLASLTVNFPAATSGKARDFGLRLTVASGITTAPQLVLPQGVVCENADGTAPEIGADGAATILYFTETAAGVFLVKGEVVQTIS